MKKKSLIVLGMSLMLSVGFAMSSYAETGWATENGQWVYYDSSGSKVTYTWKKGADNLWRYLDSSGYMAVDTWVEDGDYYYYVDSNGIMLANQWKQLDQDPYGYTGDINWFYFNDSGRALNDVWKKIDNKYYHFDEACAMETGWVDDDMYYCGEDGAAVTGWHKLYPPEDDDEDFNEFDDDDERKWYYFSSTGKKYVPENTENGYGEKHIDGSYYCFNSNGAMQTGWVNVEGTSDEFEGYRLYGSDGKGITGWLSAEPPDDVHGYDDDVVWFYFSKAGVPKVGPESGEATSSDIITINGKRYLFNTLGNPVTGLQKVYTNSSKTECTAYYFDESNCQVVKGRKTITEDDGENWTYYFQDSGKGYTGVRDSYLYYMGKLQKAESGLKYEPIHLPGGKTYLVNTSGKIVKSTSGVKDADGIKYTSNSSGVLLTVDGESVSDDYGREAVEPVWSD